mmetsp:Transcript_7524/g.11885  ORF Transcript_7524/g.11885 Transcript_7524/m.11885 type:complete len:84 (-) Transcript_7524:1238-1489(-)
MFALLATGIPDYCSSNGCLVGQVQLAPGQGAPAKTQTLASSPLPVPHEILAHRAPARATGMPGGCPVFELSADCIPTDTGAVH